MLASVTPLIMHAMSSDWEAGTVVFLGGGFKVHSKNIDRRLRRHD